MMIPCLWKRGVGDCLAWGIDQTRIERCSLLLPSLYICVIFILWKVIGRNRVLSCDLEKPKGLYRFVVQPLPPAGIGEITKALWEILVVTNPEVNVGGLLGGSREPVWGLDNYFAVIFCSQSWASATKNERCYSVWYHGNPKCGLIFFHLV